MNESDEFIVFVYDRKTWKETRVQQGATYEQVLESLGYEKTLQTLLKIWSMISGMFIPLDQPAARYSPVILQHPDEDPLR